MKLLTEGAGTIDAQILRQRCEREEYTGIFVCGVDPAGLPTDFVVPPIWRRLPRIGCIEIETATLTEYKSGHWEDSVSQVYFAGRHFFPRAWRAARLLAHSNPSRPCRFRMDELVGCFVVHSWKHPVEVIAGGAR